MSELSIDTTRRYTSYSSWRKVKASLGYWIWYRSFRFPCCYARYVCFQFTFSVPLLVWSMLMLMEGFCGESRSFIPECMRTRLGKIPFSSILILDFQFPWMSRNFIGSRFWIRSRPGNGHWQNRQRRRRKKWTKETGSRSIRSAIRTESIMALKIRLSKCIL